MKPPPPGPPKEGLEEVERALAVLGGRHPDAVRLERETLEAAARKRAENENEGRVERRRRWRRRAIVLGVGAGLSAAALVAREKLTERRSTLGRATEPLAPYVAAGFGRRLDGTLLHPERLEADIDGGTCVVAVGVGPQGVSDLVVTRDDEVTKSAGLLAWCSCAKEHVVVETPHPGGAHAAALVRADARAFAGTFGFARNHLAPKDLMTSACAEEHLDGWLALPAPERRPAAGETIDDSAWLKDSPARATLLAARFHEVGRSPSDLPFAFFVAPDNACAVALADAPGVAVTLRNEAGHRVVTGTGAVAVCASKSETWTAWPDKPTAVTVLAGPAGRVGGLLGVQELAKGAGLPVQTGWVAPDDLAWDATQTAHASGISEPTPVSDYSAPDRAMVRNARVVALSLSGGARVAPDTTKDLLFYACARPLEGAAQDICVQDGPMRWRDTSSKGRSGGAESPLPFWLQSLSEVHDADLVRAEVGLLELARRLTRAGFDPTVLESLKELPQGVDVQGRAGEDAIVAFTLSPRPPFATPCTDGPRWSLDGEPRVVPLAAGEHVVLRPLVPSSVPPDARRTVVFRRTASEPHEAGASSTDAGPP